MNKIISTKSQFPICYYDLKCPRCKLNRMYTTNYPNDFFEKCTSCGYRTHNGKEEYIA